MNGLINSSKGQLRHHGDLFIASARRCLESLVFWVLGTLRDLQDAMLAFDLIRGLVIYALDAKCSDVVMANARSPRWFGRESLDLHSSSLTLFPCVVTDPLYDLWQAVF